MRFDILEAMDQIEKKIDYDVEILLHKRNGRNRALRVSVYEDDDSHHYEIHIPETTDEEMASSILLNREFRRAVHSLNKALNRA